jgi:phosphoglycolate phosphatase-like HAD superfamily hydrolase
MDLDPAMTAVIGDSDQDAAMAAAGGMAFIAFTAGAGPLSQDLGGQNRVEMDSLANVAAFVIEGNLWRKS